MSGIPGPWADGYVFPDAAASSAAPGAAAGGAGMGSFATAGFVMAAIGAVNSAIGGYFAAKSQRWQLKSQASQLRFQQSLSQMNARQAESEATGIEVAGQQQAAWTAARYGQAKAALRASMAARGIDADVGSAAETFTSMEFAKQTDMYSINSNALRAAEAQRQQALNYRMQASMQGVSAENLMASRRTISPELSMMGSLLQSGGQLGMAYQDYSNRGLRSR